MSVSNSSLYNESRAGPNRNGHFNSETSILNSSLSNNGGFRDTTKRNCCHRCWAWANDGFTIISTCFAALTIAITIALSFQLRFGRPQISPEGAVASDDGPCSADAGLAMLKMRGSAVDAAVATLLCVSVTHPHLVGVGGGGLMLVHNHLQMITSVIDFLPDVPDDYDVTKEGSGATVAVPGFLQGLQFAHTKYGKLPWGELFEPAIHVARTGFIVSSSLEAAVANINVAQIPAPPPLFPTPNPTTNAFSTTFLPLGRRLQRGTKLTRGPYALLLEKVALFGPKAVFDTDFAVEVVELLRQSGSDISVGELQDYKVQEYAPLRTRVANHTVLTPPYPGGGAQLLAALHLLHNGNGVDSLTPSAELYRDVVRALATVEPSIRRMVNEPQHRYYLSQQLLNLTADLSLPDIFYDGLSEKSQQELRTSSLHDGSASTDNSTNDESSSSALSPEQIRALTKEKVTLLKQLNEGGSNAVDTRKNWNFNLMEQAGTQVSVVDTYDLYVSAVCGLGSHFGSLLMTSHGVLFNNMLATAARGVQGAHDTASSRRSKRGDNFADIDDGNDRQHSNVPEYSQLQRSNIKEDATAQFENNELDVVRENLLDKVTQQSIKNHSIQKRSLGEELDVPGNTSASSSLTDADPHRIGGRTRVMTPYAPFIVMDSRSACGWRSSVSTSSISASLQVLGLHVLRQEHITAAVTQARVTLGDEDFLLLLDDLSDSQRLAGSVRNFLSSSGYRLGIHKPPYNSVNSVTKFKDSLTSHSDTRGGGQAARLGGGAGAEDIESGVPGEAAEIVQLANPNNKTNSRYRSGNSDVSKPSKVVSNSDVGEGVRNIAVIANPSGFDGHKNRTGSGMRTGTEYRQGERLFLGEFPDVAVNSGVHPAVSSTPQDIDIVPKKPTGSGSVNKKYMGDANSKVVLKQGDDGSTKGSGIVVKGDRRGGIESSDGDDTTTNGNLAHRVFVNGGRGGGGDIGVNLFTAGHPHSLSPTRDNKNAAQDSVFSDHDYNGEGQLSPHHHVSQVRLDDYDYELHHPVDYHHDYTGGNEGTRHNGGNLDGAQRIVLHNNDNNGETSGGQRIVLHDNGNNGDIMHGIPLPPHIVDQLHKELQQHIQQRQQQQQQDQVFRYPHSYQQPLYPEVQTPFNRGPPVVVQRQHGHLHPVLGSSVSGRYEDVRG